MLSGLNFRWYFPVLEIQNYRMDMIINELEFYSKFARPLIFALPEATDRVLAASWVQKIKDAEAGSEKLRTDYMKLLLFALQRKKLVGIFTDDPSSYEFLEEFPSGYDLNVMAKQLIEKEQKERVENIRKQLTGHIGDYPPYTTDCSSDLREYVAAQDIPGFGVHCYYAISKYPVTTWHKSEKGIFPKMAKSAVNATSPLPAGFLIQRASETHVKGFGEDSGKIGKSLTDIHEDEPEKRKRKTKKLGQSPPVKPLGSQKFPDEDRKPPSWSSNLLDVGAPLGDSLTPRRSAATGTILKKQFEETQFQLGMEQESEFQEEYTEIEKALKDFHRGEIKEAGRKRNITIPTTFDDLGIEDDALDESDPTGVIDDYEGFLDLHESQFEEEVNEDSLLVKYFKDFMDTKTSQKGIKKIKENMKGSIPAQSGIPVTTPRPSVSPKRQPSAEKLHKQVFPFKNVTEEDLLESTIRNPEKDPEMTKLFLEATEIEEDEPKEFQQEYIYDKRLGHQQYIEEGMPLAQSPPRERMTPPSRGSPAANAIVSEVIPSLEMGAEAESSRYEPFQTPPRFLMASIPELPLDREIMYIDYLFGKDKDTAEMLRRVAHVVSDVEQDIPDPTHLFFPPTPPLADVGPMPFLQDETFDDLYPLSPPPLSPPTSFPGPSTTTLQKQSMPARPEDISRSAGSQPSEIASARTSKSEVSRISKPPGSTRIARPAVSHPSSKTKIAKSPEGVQQPGIQLPQPQRPTSPATQRTPSQRPARPMYFPSVPMGMSEWPSPDETLASQLQEHQIDPRFRDTSRPKMTGNLVVGRTGGRKRPIERKYVPPLASSYPIAEVQDERYPFNISRSPQQEAAPFPDDDTMFEFARGYVPPAYQSPTGLFEESPPHLEEADRRHPLSVRNWLKSQREESQKVIDQMRRTLDKSEQIEAHLTDIKRAEADQLRTPPRVRRPPLSRRRLDFEPIDVDTDTYLSHVMARHPDLSPLPSSEVISQREEAPPRIGIPGWDSPERPAPATPPFYQMPVSSQMLDAAQSPFEGVEMSPKDYDYFDIYTEPEYFVEDANADFFDRDEDFQNLLQSPPMSPHSYERSPQDWRFSPPSPQMSPQMSPEMLQMRERLEETDRMGPDVLRRSRRNVPRARPVSTLSPSRQNADISRAQFKTPLRRGQRPPPMPSIPGTPPSEDIYGLPTLAQYSPLSFYVGPTEIRTTRNFKQNRIVTRRPCCSYHQNMRSS